MLRSTLARLRPTGSIRASGDRHFEAPVLQNQWKSDAFLQRCVGHFLQRSSATAEQRHQIEADLDRFGNRVVADLLLMHEDAEANPPELRAVGPWGRRDDHLVLTEGWKQLHRVSAQEGLVAAAYDSRPLGRLQWAFKAYLFNPSAGMYCCPLAMTDGAARVLEQNPDTETRARALPHLTTRDADSFWTSGQWMTERRGGSDVGNATETVAREHKDGFWTHTLHGLKWFSSATDCQMSLALARELDASGQPVPGSRGLSLFYLELRNPDGRLKNIEIQRLKEKLGTRQLPTAELVLSGTPARRISAPGRGIPAIAEMLNITRLHNSVTAASGMRRAVALAADYARKRHAFGAKLIDLPLQAEVIARLQTETMGCAALCFEAARLMGLIESGAVPQDGDVAQLLRCLTPVLKLYTGKQAVAVASEGLECFGGAGYMEDTGLPQLRRDAQVLPIWEGTTNVLSLDLLRALGKNGQALQLFGSAIDARLSAAAAVSELAPSLDAVRGLWKRAVGQAVQMAKGSREASEVGSRSLAFLIARAYGGALLAEIAAATHDPADIAGLRRWATTPPIAGEPVVEGSASHLKDTASILSSLAH